MTPAETARNEAAKQAVILVFGVAAALIMMPFYRRMADRMADQQADMLRKMNERMDPTMRRIQELEQARAVALEQARRWDRLASVLFLFGTQRAFWWAHDRAERARAAYEAERP